MKEHLLVFNLEVIEESMMEEIVHETSWYAFVLHWLQETYHTRLSSITQDDICVCTVLTDYQKSTYQQAKSLSSISIDCKDMREREALGWIRTSDLYHTKIVLFLTELPRHLC